MSTVTGAQPTTAAPAPTASERGTIAPTVTSSTIATQDALRGMVVPAGAMETPSRGGATLAPTVSGRLDGRTIVVDPGHSGAYSAAIGNKPVPAGDGATKACNTSGTDAIDGTPEHAVTWAVGVRVVGLLRAQGANVILTRPNDAGMGPCVDERAAIVNRNKADLLLSIHGDGADVASARGYHVIVSSRMAGGSALQERSLSVARSLVGELARTGLPRSTYVGDGTGIDQRSDIAGVNLLSSAPGVMLEMGNLRSAADWGVLKTPQGQDAVASSLAAAAQDALGR